MDDSFAEDLIKGKIAEVIFAQMFREAGKYSVIPFGYENLVPGFIFQGSSEIAKKVKDNISTSPDFALISHDREKIYLVEVKYRSHFDKVEFEDLAKEQKNRWYPSFIFVAAPDGFRFGSCTNIIKNGGAIARLNSKWIGEGLRNKYLELLNRFEK